MNDDYGKTKSCAMWMKRFMYDDGISAVSPISELNSSNNWSYETKPKTWKGKLMLYFHRVHNELYAYFNQCFHFLNYAPKNWKIAIISSFSLFFLSLLVIVATYVFTNVIILVPNIENSKDSQIVSLSPLLEQTSHPSFIKTLFPSDSPKTYLPTFVPSQEPTIHSSIPKSSNPTLYPTFSPTFSPTLSPTLYPTLYPTYKKSFTVLESFQPSNYQLVHSTNQSNTSYYPNFHKATSDTINPTQSPSNISLNKLSSKPTQSPTLKPIHSPFLNSSKKDSFHPTIPLTF